MPRQVNQLPVKKMSCRICTELGEECRGMYNDCIQKEEETPEEEMNKMELHDILHLIIYVDIVKYNETHNIAYFKSRLANETTNKTTNDKLKNDAMCILDKLIDEIEDFVSYEKPETQEIRRKNLNALVDMCEEIVGV